jgi:amino acid adenylation domain-containing protein
MNATAETNDQYWRGVLLSGGCNTLPRWTRGSKQGVAELELPIPDRLARDLGELADESGASLSSIVLAAHARVLAAQTGEQEVVTGYTAPLAGEPLPCRLSVTAESWRALLEHSGRIEADLLAHQNHPVNDLRTEMRLPGPPFEGVFDPTGEEAELPDDTVLSIGLRSRDGRPTLWTGYRTEAFDRDGAARIAGYHLRALELIAEDPGADHRRQSLLSDDELRLQIDRLAGPRRPLPDRRFHELFEERVQQHPEAIAAVHGDREWTYRELNARANRLGRAIVDRGVEREGVVAVVTERNLDWMAAVLAIFKAGGVYLPIEPHFPADRIAVMLQRSDCRLVVTETGSTTTVDEALESLSEVQTLFVDDVWDEVRADTDLGIEVGRDQLAYIYFTSGSTGEPKGAMCEHAGMFNHLVAKIDDFEIGEGQVVAQIAPQCFDISLWQLVSALLVGGRTVIIEQDTILDPQRFVDRIVETEVAVMQVVPSYLEVLLSFLDQHPRELPDLHCVSVTGEALKLELVHRWFDSQPATKLANAYGLTETSDDTNHEVMDRPPAGKAVPLGRAVNNVHVYVVDESLAPVPLGAQGEIVFSGVCVGRGYINDPERTRLAYMADPIRPGERLYRSGDFGRWRPDGKLEYLGRRDAQVKIRGFRIEIGEIENAMLQVPGVREGAIVLADKPDGNKQLVAFYAGRQLETAVLQDQLGQSLPEYMVPTVIHWRESLPLTANGKVDRKTLTALAGELDAGGGDVEAPITPSEQRLAAEWARILGLAEDQIGRNDDFFDQGGTSLSAVEVVIALDGDVSLKDITRHPVLADLAMLIDGSTAAKSGLLQLLSDPGEETSASLVCFPYAGGNAVNFQAMARSLRGSGLAVHAVELPGHDLAADSGPFASLKQIVEQVVSEIIEHVRTPVLVWGHSSGTAFAAEATRRLEDAGVNVERVFFAAQLPGAAAARRAHLDELQQRSDAEIAATLTAGSGYTELGELEARHAEQVGAAYRHDVVSAHTYFLDALDAPPTAKLATPVTVVVGDDDPSTAGWRDRHREWLLVADHVDLADIPDGGHYFLRTHPTAAAEIVLDRARSLHVAAGVN